MAVLIHIAQRREYLSETTVRSRAVVDLRFVNKTGHR
jgi:hypothetical protein